MTLEDGLAPHGPVGRRRTTHQREQPHQPDGGEHRADGIRKMAAKKGEYKTEIQIDGLSDVPDWSVFACLWWKKERLWNKEGRLTRPSTAGHMRA